MSPVYQQKSPSDWSRYALLYRSQCRYIGKVLKDIWRIVGYRPDGEVYARLQNSVKNVPVILWEGDVEEHNEGSHSCGLYDGAEFPPDSSIHQHKHYRLVLGVVGSLFGAFVPPGS